ncbi:MAG TPA: histidinol-phosphatase HisJ family protein [candidate division Zixibacteria bacterium]|nr:histidinol-phosphatase HisJ family protein [candidate division Zixibacteria bacterium]MDD4918565.1 histidinol-phosphatase HisJ family protein [candidate division Zixibacteria bacterium]MDM7971958.1 histidinol-phosphatase HisJ family protein [candidate division Zixibacteria bacterium]HOD65625.1 histidinol-phosphatase HisJ family protein [candidate division Zixibacteria bacterium]HOZ07843.1 histidinol-phosphatase HisJ family protein [candidate division Zixibacteria bacterium]
MSEPNIARLATPHLTDFHVHCDYSTDAVGTIDEYCRAALARGLAEICFVTHYDTNPAVDSGDCFVRIKGVERRAAPEHLAPYVDEVHRAHDEYYPRGLMVKLGIEVGWWEGCEDTVRGAIERYPFDYVLCGIHDVGDVCICSHDTEGNLGRMAPERLIEEYFRQAVLAARTGLFSALAHLTYYRRFGEQYYGSIINELHRPYLPELWEALRAGGTAMEINTSAIRHGLGEYYPPPGLIHAARRAGVRVERLGSDSHRPEQVGLDFDAAAPLVAEQAPYYGE